MKVALFTDTFPPQVNGVANTVYRQAVALTKLGHTVRVYTVSKLSAEEVEAYTGNLFTVYTFPSLKAMVYPGERAGVPYVGLFNELDQFRPDIIHTNTPFAVGWNAVASAKRLKVPLVGTHHTFFDHYLRHIHLDYAWANKLSWALTVWYYNHCDVVISPSRSLERALREHGLTKQIELLQNTLDTTFYVPAPEAVARPAHQTLVYMGRLSYEKSIDDVVSAAAKIIQKLPGTRLLIIGDGPERQKLETQVAKLGLTNNTTFTGFLYGKDLVAKLQEGDVFLTGSKSENMPLALLEAMAVGLPIVAVRSLGLEEMLRDGENAYLVSPDNSVAELASRTMELLQNDSLRQRFSATSRELSLVYSESAVVQKMFGLYSAIIGRVSGYVSTGHSTSGPKA